MAFSSWDLANHVVIKASNGPPHKRALAWADGLRPHLCYAIHMNHHPEVIIYTDGACDPNPGPGGWAAVLRSGQHERVLTGSELHTTNNRMELQAVIAALTALKQPSHVQLHTDSTYVQKGVTEYLERWKTRHWQTADKKAVANQDLWQALDEALQQHHIEWVWVKGHAGDPLNERVDRLAVSMIDRAALPLDDVQAIHIFTGVSCSGTTGGWAAIVKRGDTTQELSGFEVNTSANRLHLLAAQKGLEAVPAESIVHVYTPSDYAAQGATQWVKNWAAQGWHTKEGRPVKHREVWQAIVRASTGREVKWHSLKDEARPAESRRAEELARGTRSSTEQKDST
jgi:ribonuclease HI